MKAVFAVGVACAAFGHLGGIMFSVDPSGTSDGLDALLASMPLAGFLLVGLCVSAVYGVAFSAVTLALR